jgi:hypothetical protein
MLSHEPSTINFRVDRLSEDVLLVSPLDRLSSPDASHQGQYPLGPLLRKGTLARALAVRTTTSS